MITSAQVGERAWSRQGMSSFVTKMVVARQTSVAVQLRGATAQRGTPSSGGSAFLFHC